MINKGISKRSTRTISFPIFLVFNFFLYCLYICKSIRSNIISWLTEQWASDCILCFAHIYFSAIWEHNVSWKHSRKCVSMALERFLEWHDLGLKVTTFTICLLKIPRYMATAPRKTRILLSEESTGLLYHSAFILLGKEWSPPFSFTVCPSLLVPIQTSCQFDQTDDQPERNPTLIEVPLQTD